MQLWSIPFSIFNHWGTLRSILIVMVQMYNILLNTNFFCFCQCGWCSLTGLLASVFLFQEKRMSTASGLMCQILSYTFLGLLVNAVYGIGRFWDVCEAKGLNHTCLNRLLMTFIFLFSLFIFNLQQPTLIQWKLVYFHLLFLLDILTMYSGQMFLVLFSPRMTDDKSNLCLRLCEGLMIPFQFHLYKFSI